MLNNILLKLLSESLLSLYPSIVKLIDYPVFNQSLIRFSIYTLIGLFFISNELSLNKYTLLLGLINFVHILSSYIGFNNLDLNISYTLFYIYPLFILLFSGSKLNITMLLPIIATYLIYNDETKEKNKKSNKFIFGLIAIIIAAMTEAGIYFNVKKINYKNNMNIVFLAYGLPLIIMILFNKKIKKFITKITEKKEENLKVKNKNLIKILLLNGLIGVLGYYIRFYLTNKMNAKLFSILSYSGIIFSIIYSKIFRNENMSVKKIIGIILILLFGLLNYNS
jgi:drug/metabolite transporter (DMT)-like permease